jgi:DNA mismatch repair protein MutL
MVIDKHAAHERILFEDMKKILYASESHSQTLLVPESVSLSNEEVGALCEYESEIRALGFDFDIDGKQLLLKSIPSIISLSDARDMIVTIAGQIASGTGSESVAKNIAFEKALYQASCKAAMKAGVIDNEANTRFIVDRLFEIPDIKYCPHGRPCAFELSESELEKRFKRT